MNERKLRTNLDTDLLKLAAVVSMLLDHVGAVFFPQIPAFRWAGRLAFPLFCYCMTVGMLYTRDIKRYLGRLGAFALISQPAWILAFNPDDVWGNLTNWNIFFTLFLSLLAMYGFKERRWWLFALGAVLLMLFNFDYGINGVILMLIFYLCRNQPSLGAVLYTLFWLPALWSGWAGDPRTLMLGSHAVDWAIFALLALPLIYCPTHTNLKMPKWFFYAFYPLHLGLIALVRWGMGI